MSIARCLDVNSRQINRSTKSSSEEGNNADEINRSDVAVDASNAYPMKIGPSLQIHDKYRCDQMVLEHNNEPINYEQILLPVPTMKKYFTG